MKFLCVKCDGQMLLREVKSHEGTGSLSVIFHCPECGQATAMLTNSGETQLVTSLGIKIGNGETKAEEKKSGCPFAAMLQAEAGGAEAAHAAFPGATSSAAGIIWSSEARARLENIPEIVRPMAKSGIEKFAQERGYTQIDIAVLEAAKTSML